jgi:hypothetical protein
MNDLNTQTISVISPVTTAIDRVKLMLFNPFNIEKWFAIGFCAWLVALGDGFGGGCGNFGNRWSGSNPCSGEITEHLPLIIGIGSAIAIVVLAIVVAIMWLSSRGQFMFLHCVAENKAEVKIPWHKYRSQANSLFLFRLIVMVLSLVCFALLAGVMIMLFVISRKSHSPVGFIFIAIFSGLLTIPLVIIFALISKFTKDFVVPVMYLRNCTCLNAWREFLTLLGNNKGMFALYILFQIAIAMAISAIVMAAVCVTCCIAGCLMAIPYLGTVLLLPVFVFKRSYSLYYLKQHGPAYDVFAFAESQVSPPAALEQ